MLANHKHPRRNPKPTPNQSVTSMLTPRKILISAGSRTVCNNPSSTLYETVASSAADRTRTNVAYGGVVSTRYLDTRIRKERTAHMTHVTRLAIRELIAKHDMMSSTAVSAVP